LACIHTARLQPQAINVVASTNESALSPALISQILNDDTSTLALGAAATQLMMASGIEGTPLRVRKDGYVVNAMTLPSEGLAALGRFDAVIYTGTLIHL